MIKERERWSYTVSTKNLFVETKEVNKKGKPVTMPVVQRVLYLTVTGQPAFMPANLRVVRVKRQGCVTFSVTCLAVTEASYADSPAGYKTATSYTKWCPSLTQDELLTFLRVRFGQRAVQVLSEYLDA